LPARFETRDGRADGGSRQIEINRERVVVRRMVRGMRMTLQLRMPEFIGIARRQTEDAEALVLIHRDPSLSVPLFLSADIDEIERQWMAWSETLALPQVEEEGEATGEPAPRRRRHNVIYIRRPRFLTRRKAGHPTLQPTSHHGEREIIARN
jgi:hypothetical protein